MQAKNNEVSNPHKIKQHILFSRQYVGQDYSHKKTAAGKVTLDQIDGVSTQVVVFFLITVPIPWNLHGK